MYRTGCRVPVQDLADSSLRSIFQPSGAVTRSSNVSASRSSGSAAGNSASRSLNRRISLQRRRADDEGHGYSRCLALDLHLRLDRICTQFRWSPTLRLGRVSATKVGHKPVRHDHTALSGSQSCLTCCRPRSSRQMRRQRRPGECDGANGQRNGHALNSAVEDDSASRAVKSPGGHCSHMAAGEDQPDVVDGSERLGRVVV